MIPTVLGSTLILFENTVLHVWNDLLLELVQSDSRNPLNKFEFNDQAIQPHVTGLNYDPELQLFTDLLAAAQFSAIAAAIEWEECVAIRNGFTFPSHATCITAAITVFLGKVHEAIA